MDYAGRRERLMQEMGPHSALVLAGPPEQNRSRDTHYAYRPGSDVLYLSGFEEPGTVLVLLPGHDTPFVMFVRPKNRDSEIWDGFRYGPEGACDMFGANAAFSRDVLDEKLGELLAGRRVLYHALGVDSRFDSRLLGILGKLGPSRTLPDRAPRTITDPRPLIHELRRCKDSDEIARMEIACRISAQAHLTAMKATRPGLFEYQIQGILEGTFAQHGARWPAYGSIVAGGAGACVLHYVSNDKPLRDGDLLLVDAGAEYQWYAGDITRTWPVGRTFSGPQRDVYQAVLDVQEAIIAACAPGATKHDLQNLTVRLLTQKLVDLGLLTGDLDGLIERDAYRRFYMHGIGHYLGMDVHDVGTYYTAADVGFGFDPGVIFTVEPGLYIAPDDETVPEAYRGIGVRIEDDVLITETGCRILTGDVPKSIAEIEAIRAASLDR